MMKPQIETELSLITRKAQQLSADCTGLEADMAKSGTPPDMGRPPGRTYRTRARAREAGAVAVKRDTLAIPTTREYQNALSPIRSKNAHLQPLAEALASQMTYRDGKLYYLGQNIDDSELIRYHDDSPEASAGIDLPLLCCLYSQMLYSMQEDFKTPEEIAAAIDDPEFRKYSITLFVPEFLQMIGLKSHINQSNIDRMITKIERFHNIMGIIPTRYGPSHYPAMLLIGHDAEKNTVEIASPYFNQIAMRSRRDSIQMDRKRQPRLKNDGRSFMNPTHTFLVKARVASERNKNAVAIVCVVVTVIEQAGYSGPGKPPHISAQTIIDRCPGLKYALEGVSTSNKNTILKRSFGRAWELLETCTYLKQTYKNIKFPTAMPTSKHLDMVFEFPHEGKTT